MSEIEKTLSDEYYTHSAILKKQYKSKSKNTQYYKLEVPAGTYTSNSLFSLLWEVFKHRCWHLWKHKKWMD